MIRKYLIAALGSFVLTVGSAQAQKVTVAHTGESFAWAPFYVARTMGYFDKLGLKIDAQNASSGKGAGAAVVSGAADVWMTAVTSILPARQQGVDLVTFAPLTTQFTSNVVISKNWAAKNNITADSPLDKKYKALNGIRIAVTGPGSGQDQLVRFLANQAGIDPDRNMTIVSVGGNPSSALAALQQGQVDAFTYSPPHTQIAAAEQGAVLLFNNFVGEVKALDGYFYTGMSARRDWLDKNPETATKFVAAIQMGLDAIRNSEEAKELVRKTYFDNLDRNIYNEIWRDLPKAVPVTVDVTSEMMVQVIEFVNKFSSDKIDASKVSEFYTNKFAANAIKLARPGK